MVEIALKVAAIAVNKIGINLGKPLKLKLNSPSSVNKDFPIA